MLRLLPLPLSILWASTALAVPQAFHHQGRLLDTSGTPVNGVHQIDVTLHDAPTVGNPVWTQSFNPTLVDGYFDLRLQTGASGEVLDPATMSGALWVGISVDGNPEGARVPLASVPFAIRADTAANVDGGVVNASQVQIGGVVVLDSNGLSNTDVPWNDLTGVPSDLINLSCTTDQVARHNGTAWVCATDDDHQHSVTSLAGESHAASAKHTLNIPTSSGTGMHIWQEVYQVAIGPGAQTVYWNVTSDWTADGSGILDIDFYFMPEYSHASSTAVRKYSIPFAPQTTQTNPVVLLGTTSPYYTSVVNNTYNYTPSVSITGQQDRIRFVIGAGSAFSRTRVVIVARMIGSSSLSPSFSQ